MAVADVLDQYQRWRAMTLDLLGGLDEESLRFRPGQSVGELWKQFRHLGRIEDNYMAAIGRGRIAFGPPRRLCQGATAQFLGAYLADQDADLREAVADADPDMTVDWWGEAVGLSEHLNRLANHELLHHGELIMYVRMLGRSFPSSWTIWGL